MLVVFALVSVNVYFLGLRGGTSIGALLRTTRVRAPAPEGAPAAAAAKGPTVVLREDPVGSRVVDGALADGQTIALALTPHLGQRPAAEVEAALGEKLDLASVHAGQAFTVVYDVEERPLAVEFRVDKALAHRVELTDRKLPVSSLNGRFETRVVELALPAGPAMAEAARRAGETHALVERLAEVFAAEGDLVAAASSERVRVIVEKRLVAGKLQRYGRVLGAEWVTRAGVRRAFSFGGQAYTERGESAARTYLATVLRPGKAPPSRRTVQTLPDGRVVVEQPAAPGAIAWAVAAGTVTALTRGPAGATLTLEVARGERVVYAHLGKLARGIGLGADVAQGRALAHVDGSVTVTFEGKAELHDGRSLPPRLSALPASERPRFGETIAPLLERLRALALRERDPLASPRLSAIP